MVPRRVFFAFLVVALAVGCNGKVLFWYNRVLGLKSIPVQVTTALGTSSSVAAANAWTTTTAVTEGKTASMAATKTGASVSWFPF